MNNTFNSGFGRIKIISFFLAALLHIVLIMFVAFRAETTRRPPEPSALVMRLVDLREYIPPPPEVLVETGEAHTHDLIAAIIIELEELPPSVSEPVNVPLSPVSTSAIASLDHDRGEAEGIVYLPQHRVTLVPVLPEDQIRRNTVYPPIAQRSGIEGIVFLELLIDHLGNINDIIVLRETPQARGFAEAAVNAFYGISAVRPAELNGEPVAVRFRYPIRFTLR